MGSRAVLLSCVVFVAAAAVASDRPDTLQPVPTGSAPAATAEEAAARRAWRIDSLLRDLRTEYADLGEVVSLTPDERDTLLRLVAAYRVQSMEAEIAHATDGRAGKRALRRLEAQHQSDRIRLLGEERDARVAEFEETLPVRMETRLVAELLADTPWPLSQEQSRRLTGAAIKAFDQQGDAGSSRSGAVNPDALTQEVEASLGKDYVILLQVARAVLNGEQYAHYAKYMEQRAHYPGDRIP
jgi:hypothetical protein